MSVPALVGAQALLLETVTLDEPRDYIIELRDGLEDLAKACTDIMVERDRYRAALEEIRRANAGPRGIALRAAASHALRPNGSA